MVAVLYYFGNTIFHACLIIIRVRLWNIFHYHCLVKTIKRVKALYNFENPALFGTSFLALKLCHYQAPLVWPQMYM